MRDTRNFGKTASASIAGKPLSYRGGQKKGHPLRVAKREDR